MEFIECIETLKGDFSNDCCVQDKWYIVAWFAR